jgi:alkane 1-monooxygenase
MPKSPSHWLAGAQSLRAVATVQSVPVRYALANVMIAGSITAVSWGGWPVWVALAAIYATGGPLDEVLDESSVAAGPGARWFCNANLYFTLPLILLLTYVFVRFAAGAHFIRYSATGVDPEQVPFSMWRQRSDLAAAALLVGSCYAIFGATVAHELTHRSGRIAQFLARVLLSPMWNTSFTIFHVQVHHRHVATDRDCATARRGEYIVAFAVRTLVGQYREAFRCEAERLRARGRQPWSWRNRFLSGQLMSIAIVGGAAAEAGGSGVFALLAAAFVGRTIHELVNYIQHYGLVRVEGALVAGRHSWDCRRAVSNAMYCDLPRHSEHHLFASKPHWELAPTPQAPLLPHGYLMMVMFALIPSLWRRTMGPRLADWDQRLASDAERAIIFSRGWEKLC